MPLCKRSDLMNWSYIQRTSELKEMKLDFRPKFSNSKSKKFWIQFSLESCELQKQERSNVDYSKLFNFRLISITIFKWYIIDLNVDNKHFAFEKTEIKSLFEFILTIQFFNDNLTVIEQNLFKIYKLCNLKLSYCAFILLYNLCNLHRNKNHLGNTTCTY